MKIFGMILISAFISNAQAAWVATKCSNSDASVTWQYGHDSDQINLKYSNFVEGTLTLDIEQVKIEMAKDVTLKERSFRNCKYAGSSKVYAGKVKITASEKHPNVLLGQFPENKVLTEVICTTTYTAESRCSQ